MSLFYSLFIPWKSLDKTFIYEYNGIGNLTAVKSYNYTTGAVSGTPGTTALGYTNDKLTTFVSKAITYNSNGGVASYDGWDYTWSKGKLSTLRMEYGGSARIPGGVTKPTLKNSKTYSFTYNAQGQRVTSTYSHLFNTDSIVSVDIGEVTAYTKIYSYDSFGRLISVSTTETLYGEGTVTSEIVFLYDQGSMVGMQYTSPTNGTNVYYYLRNLQGDVIGIYDTSGNLKVKYNYDAWGNCEVIYIPKLIRFCTPKQSPSKVENFTLLGDFVYAIPFPFLLSFFMRVFLMIHANKNVTASAAG